MSRARCCGCAVILSRTPIRRLWRARGQSCVSGGPRVSLLDSCQLWPPRVRARDLVWWYESVNREMRMEGSNGRQMDGNFAGSPRTLMKTRVCVTGRQIVKRD